MRLLLALLLATPVLAQSSAPVATPATETEAVDPALVGVWTLDEVVDPGVLADFGVEVQAMTCTFSGGGGAEMSMTAVQDGETLSRDRSFSFTTRDGEIVEEGRDAVPYRLLDDGSMELQDDQMVIRFVRAAPTVPSTE